MRREFWDLALALGWGGIRRVTGRSCRNLWTPLGRAEANFMKSFLIAQTCREGNCPWVQLTGCNLQRGLLCVKQGGCADLGWNIALPFGRDALGGDSFSPR